MKFTRQHPDHGAKPNNQLRAVNSPGERPLRGAGKLRVPPPAQLLQPPPVPDAARPRPPPPSSAPGLCFGLVLFSFSGNSTFRRKGCGKAR